MTFWQYLTAEEKGGMLTLPNGEAGEMRQSLRGGLDFLGSQGWELVSVIERRTLGATSHTLIFKRPSET